MNKKIDDHIICLDESVLKELESVFKKCKETGLCGFDVVGYVNRHDNSKSLKVEVLNPILDKYKLQDIYNELLINKENHSESERSRLIFIVKNSFNIETDVEDLLNNPEKVLKERTEPFTFEEVYYLWLKSLIK